MFRAFTAYALRDRAVVLAALLLFAGAGVAAFRHLPVEAYPDVTNVQVQIITLFPGHAAEEVEQLVTIPVENQMNGIPKRASLRSISLFGLSVVTIVFEDDADSVYVRNQAFERLQAVAFPPGAQPGLSPDSTPVGEIYRYTLRAPAGFSPLELKALEDWVVERKLRQVPGVVDVVGFGGPTKQVQVLVDPLKLKAYGVSLKQVLDALAAGNRNAGGAYIEHGNEMYVVRGIGMVQSLDDVAEIAVASRGGTPIYIRDVGQVTAGAALRLGRVGKLLGLTSPGSAADEDDVVQGTVLLRKGENALEVLARVRAKVAEIDAEDLPPGVRLIPHYDRTELIDRTLHTVRRNMAEGIGLVLLVLILFLGLGNWRSALIVAAVVPLSLLGAFLLLDLRGIPANLISMGAIDFGIIVDSAVVVTENLLRILEERGERGGALGAAIAQSVAETGKPILFSKAVLLTAFVPLYSLQRVEGKIFRPMALTLTFALVTGTLLAVFVVPVLLSFALRGGKVPRRAWLVERLEQAYRPALGFALRRRGLVLAAAAALLALAAGVGSRLGSEFLPKLDEGSLWVRVTMPGSISPTEADRVTTRVRRLLAGFPEVTAVVSQLGRPDDGTDINGFDTAEFFVGLKAREEWTTADNREDLAEMIRRRLQGIPGIDLTVSQVIEDNVNEAVSGIKSELSVKIFGHDPQKLQEIADRVAAVLKTVPGTADVAAERLIGQPQVQIAVDRLAVARSGLTVADVQAVIETALGGAVATQVLEGERTFDLIVKMVPEAISDLDAIRALPVLGPNGEKLTLGMLARVAVVPGFARIFREENARRTAVKLSVAGRDLGSLVAAARARVAAALRLPPGYRLEWTGAFENQQRAVQRLEVIVPLTLVAVFFLLFLTFDSPRLAFLILLNVPFAAVGGVLALAVAGLALSVSALVGFIALFGVAVQNGVLMVERIREVRAEGRSREDAIRLGALTRMRAVVMTAMMAALGLLPAALSRAVGAETSRPFAVVIVGGLITATLLTLFVLPLLYSVFERETAAASPTTPPPPPS
ncbi:MAG TPA: CusA/CzcA family heavy metal efflux RND transporter [Thermoanaerobaculia bacterium]|nr:CusA/CzcA family heavy metal efflux RND transporter [Thermoanaerobaculia bacterium]